MKFCPNCGNPVSENQFACGNCGTRLGGNNQVNPQTNIPTNNTTIINNTYNTSNTVLVPERNIIVCVILSIVTCGIYSLYWFVKITDESKSVSNGTNAGGLLAIVFTIISCYIYSIYWAYKTGKNMYTAGQIHNKPISDNSILYVVLSIFGLGIVNYCLIQSDLNKFSK